MLGLRIGGLAARGWIRRHRVEQFGVGQHTHWKQISPELSLCNRERYSQAKRNDQEDDAEYYDVKPPEPDTVPLDL